MKKDKSSSGKHPDIIPAQATLHERQQTMKHQVRKFKSPKLSDKYTIAIPGLRITYYIKTAKRYKARIKDPVARYSLMLKALTVQNVAQIIELKRNQLTGEPLRNIEIKNFDQIQLEEGKEAEVKE